MLSKIISGGQAGADRAGLDVAIKHNFPHSGWCPKGRKAEDGPIGSAYLLAESPSANYLQRTEWNARDADGTAIFTMSATVSGGSKRTIDFAQKHTNPWIHLHPEMDKDPVEALRDFVERHQIQNLNVAGTRGSKEPQLYAWVSEVLEAAFFATDDQRAVAAALEYLGPEMVVTSVVDNTDAPLSYGEKMTDNCWRVYFTLRTIEPTHVGGDSPYILIEKETHRVLGHGIERGE